MTWSTRGQALGHNPERTAEPIRAYERFERVDVEEDSVHAGALLGR